MAIFSAIFAITYPLEPSQISLISMFTIGLPGFLLALEPNRDRIEGNFMVNVMLKALPAGDVYKRQVEDTVRYVANELLHIDEVTVMKAFEEGRELILYQMCIRDRV